MSGLIKRPAYLERLLDKAKQFSTGRAPAGVRVAGLKGGSLPFCLARLRLNRQHPNRQDPWLIVVETFQQAEQLLNDLLFFAPELKSEFSIFPAWEPYPFDTFSPHPDVMASRIELLYRLLQQKGLCVITTVDALMQKVIPQETLIDRTIFIKKGAEIDRPMLVTQLIENGYSCVTTVEDRGTFAVRGGILDIFTPASEKPYRLEFLGDEIESIRHFDGETQRSLAQQITEATLLPVREVIYTQKAVARAIEEIKKSADEKAVKKSERDQIIEYLTNRIYFSGIDYYAPFFYERLETFFDYFSESFEIFYIEQSKIIQQAKNFEAECQKDYGLAIEKKRIAAEVSDFYLSAEEFYQKLAPRPFWNVTALERLDHKEESCLIQTENNEDIRHELTRLKKVSTGILEPVARKLKDWHEQGYRIFFVAHTQLQQKRFQELMTPYGLRCLRINEYPALSHLDSIRRQTSLQIYDVLFLDGMLSSGFRFPDEKFVFITEEEIFGERKKRTAVRKSEREPFITNLSELKPGNPVVHVDHGVGRYQGLKKIKVGQGENDTVLIEYADQDRLYLPVHRLNMIQRYAGGDEERLRLDKLGGAGWEKTKKRVRRAIQEIAYELLQIYAARQTSRGHAFSPPDAYFHEFEATFPYEETEDQSKAIDEVISDLCSEKSMDRVVCGDVGYGKTEVAIRAAFKVVMDHQQVVLLAPTTLLVDQHFRVFSQRLSQFPVRVAMLSRFLSHQERKRVVWELKAGKIDIIIGTHRLLSHDIECPRLGLLIIDEEQCFGVVQKEKIKKMKKTVDVLTLTATPIPRTLHMSLLGIRDLSVINTPPLDRRAIRTYISHFEEQTIREAILREIQRGGQIFFVHNRVQTIHEMADRIQKIVPEAKVRFAHGQMREALMESVMHDFLNQKFNVLVCTTIVGSGIDMPTVNTIIIDRADMLGLSSLYQLRGRVGRSHERAYAYLIIPPEDRLTGEARNRLQAIQGASELGAGFKIASHDLEIRGGGHILGKNQSGHIEAVGFEMYTELLEQTVRELKGEVELAAPEPEIHLKVDAHLPEEYMPDMGDKLTFYHHLAMIRSEEEIADIEAEMRDRFGPVPEVVYNLFELMAIKFYLKKLKIKAIDFGNQKVVLTFSDQTPVDPLRLMERIEQKPEQYRMISSHKLVIGVKQWKEILPLVRQLSNEWL